LEQKYCRNNAEIIITGTRPVVRPLIIQSTFTHCSEFRHASLIRGSQRVSNLGYRSWLSVYGRTAFRGYLRSAIPSRLSFRGSHRASNFVVILLVIVIIDRTTLLGFQRCLTYRVNTSRAFTPSGLCIKFPAPWPTRLRTTGRSLALYWSTRVRSTVRVCMSGRV
jgi:hypothetical protein